MKDCIPYSSRLIQIKFHNHGPDLSFISQYAPHSGRPQEEKNHHWETLQNIIMDRPQNSPTYVLGDANARLHGCVNEVEEQCIGHHVFGYGAQHVGSLPEDQKENRQLLIDFCLFADFLIMNTLFLKPTSKKCTFKETATEGFTAPWSPDRFAQIDFILAPRAFKNSILDISARTDIAFNSDHSIVTANLRVKLKAQPKNAPTTVVRFHQPTESQKQQYNDAIRHCFNASAESQHIFGVAKFVQTMKQAAERILPRKNKAINRSYISGTTWNLIEERQKARENGDCVEESRLNKEVSKSAKRDKQQWKLNKLEDLTDCRECWKNIKFEKSNFTPNFYSMKDVHGNRVPNSQKASALADYLHYKHWGPNEVSTPIDNTKLMVLQNIQAEIGIFQSSEVTEAIHRLKTNKAPGPDGSIVELFKYLDSSNVDSLTNCLNALWRAKLVPDDFTQAHIASLYKKGDHENPENYRPISLLNVSYKIYAYILKSRLAMALEEHLSPTQFGFRASRSTIDPLFCLRRLTDVVEQGHDKLILIFLDWEKAFDKISHEKMFQSLHRMSIPVEILDAIKAIYQKPMFQVMHRDKFSSWLSQRTGIRQGCPLSPYLFIVTMHVLFHDVHRRFNDPRYAKTFQGINFHELLYADDTLILTKSFASANQYLHLIEEESQYLDLNLNKSKCCYIAFNCRGSIAFQNGDPMKSTDESTYLGASITRTVNPKHEIRRRISATMAILKKLDIFWGKAQCNRSWKLRVFNAVITSKVLYGLETLEPTESAGRLLNTFQLKGLRKILKLHTTYIQRHNTNEYVYRRANETLNAPTTGFDRKIKPLTEILEERKLKLLGHILRRDRNHPLHQATFSTTSALPRETEMRRVGRPRQFWTSNNMQKAWEVIRNTDPSAPQIPFDRYNREIRERIIEQAHLYQPPFHKGNG